MGAGASVLKGSLLYVESFGGMYGYTAWGHEDEFPPSSSEDPFEEDAIMDQYWASGAQ